MDDLADMTYTEKVKVLGLFSPWKKKSEGMDEHVSTCKMWEGISWLAYISGRGLCS